jgi:hypothetical protein
MSSRLHAFVLHTPTRFPEGRLPSRRPSSLSGGPRHAGGRRHDTQHGCAPMLLRPNTVTVAGLLVILVVHLAYMASPLHVLMATEHPDAREMIHGDIDGRMLEAAQADDHEGDCVIEWTTSAKTLWLISPPVPLAGSIAALFTSQLPAPPIARALGPPQRGDLQALLQVFRI